MFNKIKNVLKGVKRYMDKKIEACKEILSNDKSKLTLGLAMIGVGVGIVASIYIPVPARV